MLSTGVAYLLWLPGMIGLCGLHRLYAGKVLTGIVWLLTVGLIGVGQAVDLFLIPSMIARANARHGFGNSNVNTIIVNTGGGRRGRDDDKDDYDDRQRRRRR